VGHSGHSNIIALMMGTETVPETLDFNELTRLSAREDFINSHIVIHVTLTIYEIIYLTLASGSWNSILILYT
jgi:hypothetical protein